MMNETRVLTRTDQLCAALQRTPRTARCLRSAGAPVPGTAVGGPPAGDGEELVGAGGEPGEGFDGGGWSVTG